MSLKNCQTEFRLPSLLISWYSSKTIKQSSDYRHYLLAGIPQKLANRVQHVTDCDAPLVYKAPRTDEQVTLLLVDLHWLPVKRRIEYNLLQRDHLPCSSLPFWPPWTVIPSCAFRFSVDNRILCIANRRKEFQGQAPFLSLVSLSGTIFLSLCDIINA